MFKRHDILLYSLIEPFQVADIDTRLLLSDNENLCVTGDNASTWETLLDTLAHALTGQLLRERAHNVQRNQIKKLVHRANTQESWLANESDKPHLETPNKSLQAFFIVSTAIHYLQSLRPVNYDNLDTGSSFFLDFNLRQLATNWWKDYDVEGLSRELEWIQKMTLTVLSDPNQTVVRQQHDVLRIGHFYAAVTALSEGLLPADSLDSLEL